MKILMSMNQMALRNLEIHFVCLQLAAARLQMEQKTSTIVSLGSIPTE